MGGRRGDDDGGGQGDEDVRVADALALLSERPAAADAFKTLLSMILAQGQSKAPVVPGSQQASSSTTPTMADTSKAPAATTTATLASAPGPSDQEGGHPKHGAKAGGEFGEDTAAKALSSATLPQLHLMLRETLRALSSFDLERLQRAQDADELGAAFLERLRRVRAAQHACQLLATKGERRTRWLGKGYVQLAWPLIQEDLRSNKAIQDGGVSSELLEAYIDAVTTSLQAGADSAMWSASVDVHIQAKAKQREEQAMRLLMAARRGRDEEADDDEDNDHGPS